jgi:Major Facilitator Superfamily/Sugar (and other) transporter
LFVSLMVILGTRTAIGEAAFADWGWRVPFIVSIILLGVSVYIRLSMNESPAFQKMKAEGKTSKAPLTESFGEWKNLKIVILALIGLTAGQAVIWYTGQFYALFFLTQALKVDGATANILVAVSLLIGTPFFIVFGSLSDKIGRKMIIMAGCLLGCLTYFPVFEALTKAANPDLYAAQQKNKVVVTADPAECSFQFNPTGTVKFTSSCDIAKQRLASLSVSYDNVFVAGQAASIKVGETVIPSYSSTKVDDAEIAAAKAAAAAKLEELKAAATPEADKIKAATETVAAFEKDAKAATVKAKAAAFTGALTKALKDAGYPAKADPAKVDKVSIIMILTYMMILVTMVYGPIAAMLVEMFPTRIRYTSMSLPYHIGNGWFGGLLPTTAFAIVAQTGNMYNGLWYPIAVAAMTFVVGMLFVKETKDVDIYAGD